MVRQGPCAVWPSLHTHPENQLSEQCLWCAVLWQVTAPWPVERMHEVCNVYVDSDESAASRVTKPADRVR